MKREYPRLIALFPGIAVMVRNEEEHRRMCRHNLIGLAIYMFGLAATAGWLAYVWCTR